MIPKRLAELIAVGENQQLDFKFEINSASKIAKSLVAFANSKGGKLLIGVKDNGVIAGVRTDEEIFMLESAAKIYSKPQIEFKTKFWNIDGKSVIEATISKGNKPPYFAKDENNLWHCYVRIDDKNIIANNIYLRYIQEKNKRNVRLQYKRQIEFIIDYLNDFKSIDFSTFKEGAQINDQQAENILVDLMILDIIEMKIEEKRNYFVLK